MSYHFSPGLVADFLREDCLGGGRSVQSKSQSIAARSLSAAKSTATSLTSRFGMTSELSTRSHSEAALTWYLAAFPVRPIPPQLVAAQRQTISGRKCGESWQRQLPGTYLPRTSREKRS